MGRANWREFAEPKIPRIHKKLRGPRRGHRRTDRQARSGSAEQPNSGDTGTQNSAAGEAAEAPPAAPNRTSNQQLDGDPNDKDRRRWREEMKGHIRERSPGHWAIVLEMRDPETGRRKRKWHSFVGTKRQAQIECARLLTEIKAGTHIDPSRMTV